MRDSMDPFRPSRIAMWPAFPKPAAVLSGEADILANVIANLTDDHAKLVYADWLEDHDDKRGPLLREFITAYRYGKKLPAVKSAPKPWRDLVGMTLLAKIARKRSRSIQRNFFASRGQPSPSSPGRHPRQSYPSA